MRKSEKDFLRYVGYEFTPLIKIQRKLNLDYQTAHDFASYLERQKLIRISNFDLGDGREAIIVALPINTKTWKEKYWLLIAILAYVFGFISSVISPIVTELLKSPKK